MDVKENKYVLKLSDTNKNEIKIMLGYKNDVHDARDYKYIPPRFKFGFPNSFTLKGIMPSVLNQGNLGSCVSNAIANIIKYMDMKYKRKGVNHSRLFNYYNTRVYEGTINYDSGCQIRNAIKVINKIGTSNENLWPYIISKFKIKPTQPVFNDAKKRKITKYARVSQNRYSIKSCLSTGNPIVIGFLCYNSMFTTQVSTTGIIPQPLKGEQILGGHCVLLVGYNESTKTYEFQNSWGPSWGNRGFGTLPYDFVENPNMTFDFWTLT